MRVLTQIQRGQRTWLLLGIAYLAFISLGLPDGLLGVAWPSIHTTFGVALSYLGFLQIAATIGFLLSSSGSGHAVERLGIGGLLALSSLLVTLGLAGYTLAPFWLLLVVATLLLGLGGGAIDAGINAYAAARFSPQQINWLHACYGLGATLGPLLMTMVITSGQSWRWGYALTGAVLALMAIGFWATRSNWQMQSPASTEPEHTTPVTKPDQSTLRQPAVWISMAIFFLYTGLEVVGGQWAYTLLTEGRGMATTLAGVAVGGYWGGLTLGRLVFGVLAARISPTAILRWCMVGVVFCTLLLAFDRTPLLNVAVLGTMGFLLAPIFPLLIAQTPARLGAAHATRAIGFQVAAANLGAAALPASTGVLVAVTGLEAIGPLLVGAALVLVGMHEYLRGYTRV